MNEPLVDALTRRLASPMGDSRTRRGVLRVLLGGGLAGLVSWLGTTGAGAKKPKRKRCKRREKRCGKRCISKKRCCKNADCLPGQVCQGSGTCGARSPGRLEAGDATWTPCQAAFGNRHFETYTVQWPGGPFNVEMQSAAFRSWVWIYEAKFFTPGTPCSIGAQNAQAVAPGASAQITTILPSGKYAVVATSAFDAGDQGPATGSFGLEFGPVPG
jgi:hypothetical protein